MVSYPTSVWDGSSDNRTPGQRKHPDYRDWARLIAELAATQNRVDDNAADDDDDSIDSVGTLATVTGLTAVEKGNGALHKTILTLEDVAVTITDGTTPATDGAWGTKLLYTFPAGHIKIVGAHAVFPLGEVASTVGGGTGLSDTADFELGVGSVASAQETVFGLNNGTQEDIVAALDFNLTSGASDAIESGANGTSATYDGSSTAAKVNLNVRTLGDDDSGTGADSLVVNGTITLLWVNLGDD